MSRAKYDIDAAIGEILSGKTIQETAKKFNASYISLWQAARYRGITVGAKRRDLRTPEEKIREAIRVCEKTGCWFWSGRDPRSMFQNNGALPRTPRNAARYLLGLPTTKKPYRIGPACGYRECINPEHDVPERFNERNREILDRWLQSEEAKNKIVTLEDLAREFGLTRERIRQIILNANKSTQALEDG